MKKILSLVMALTMVLGLNAAPVALKQQKAPKSTSRMELVQKLKLAHKAPMADGVTFTFASLADANKTISGVTLAIAQGSGTSSPAWNDNSNHLRIYANNTITISGSDITKIELTFGKTKASAAYAELSASTGSLVSGGESTDVGDFKTDTWTGTADEVVFSIGATGQRAVEKIVVYTDGEVPPTPPTPAGDTIYTTINHPMVLDSIADFGWIYVSGENEEYSLNIQVNTDHLLGEFTNDDIEYEYTQMIDWTAYDLVDIESIPSVVIAQVEDTLRFTVTVKATDGQVYVVTMNDYEAQPTGEETYVDIVLPEVYDATETEGWFQVLGYDVTGEYYASLCVNTDNMFGSFADADMDWEYTGLYIGETAVQLIESSIAVTVFGVADTVVYRAEALDVEGMKWIITMKDFVPTPTEVINLVTVEAEGEYYAEEGDYYATGVTAAGDQIALDIYMDELASGTFTLEDVETYYSGIKLAEGKLVEFYSADITLTVEGGNVLIEAVIIGRDIKQYNVTMEIAGAQPSGDHTIVIADYADVSFTTMDGAYTVLAEKAGASNDPVYNNKSEDLRIYANGQLTLTKNTKDGPMTKVIFNISEQGLKQFSEITADNGEVVCNPTTATVTWTGEASEIVFNVGDANTYGTNTSKTKGQFDFTSIDIEGGVTGLISTKVNKVASKCLINGQLMIIKNDAIYNFQGNLVK